LTKEAKDASILMLLLHIELHKTQVLVIDMTCFALQHFLCWLWHGVYVFGCFFIYCFYTILE